MLKRIALGSMLVAVALFMSAPLFAEDAANNCPMDKIEKRFYCADCKACFDAGPCGMEGCTAEKMCEGCKKASWCEHCSKNVGAVECCVRTCYSCEACKKQSPTAGACEGCKKDMAGKPVCAMVVWGCAGCKAEMKEGAHCDACKMDASKMCSMNGQCPHCAK